ncbi:MAG TPA: hypothetical protein VM686_23825, partial [Polyangiaceae bacterium]|nr:hypothetical protein [Polyangiaceae bacterium]
VAGASVIVGTDAATALVGTTNGDGVALLADDDALGETATVTVAGNCYQPVTFVDVPSSRLTIYLDPVLSPACGAGGQVPGGGGGTPGRGASITGELVWEATGEFMRSGWTNVPPPASEDEQWVAYVFRLASDPTDEFSLPSAVNAITPNADGQVGYNFYLSTVPGNHTLYALAGIETRTSTTTSFTAYAMGLVRGVAVGPSDTRENVYINIDVPLDHALTLDVVGPKPTSRGPDRLIATTAIGVGSQGYVLLPNGRQARPLPLSGAVEFVGVPPLIGSLTGTEYVTTARAVTGDAGATPLSVVGMLSSKVTSEPIGADAFVEIPKLVTPKVNETWNGTDLEVAFTAGGAPVDLTIVDLASGGGLINWRIVAPGQRSTIKVPDLRAFEGDIGLDSGALAILVTNARIDDFSYASLLYRDLGPRGWRAHAADLYYASY